VAAPEQHEPSKFEGALERLLLIARGYDDREARKALVMMLPDFVPSHEQRALLDELSMDDGRVGIRTPANRATSN